MSAEPGDVTQLLIELRKGDQEAEQKLIPLVYKELRHLAARYMRAERPGHSLQPTALVHEAYIRLTGVREIDWQNRAHFFAVAAQLMRRILVDQALDRLARLDPRQARIVELRFFTGLTEEETAQVLGVSPRTVKREWRSA